jgi:septation ring formation regulator EzrA
MGGERRLENCRETPHSLPDFKDERKQIERDIAFVNGLLAKDGYHPYMRELLMEAKQRMEDELRELDSQLDSVAKSTGVHQPRYSLSVVSCTSWSVAEFLPKYQKRRVCVAYAFDAGMIRSISVPLFA